jgi:penicillin-binding protein 2
MSFNVNLPAPVERSTLLRLAFLSVMTVLLFAALLARLWFLQVLAGDRFAELADSNRLRTVVSPAPRGHILATDGAELVRNRPALALTADRQLLVDDAGRPRGAEAARAVARLADLLDLEEDVLLRRINDRRYSPFRPVPVAIDVPPELVLVVRQNQELFRGIGAETIPVREYPQGELAAHLVGYLGQVSRDELADERFAGYRGGDLVGRGGLEQSYESDLRGQGGQQILVVNRRGNVIDVQSQRPAVPGSDLVTWIDLAAQRATEDALREGILASRSIRRTDGRLLPSTAGSAIVMDARTGGIVAMASYPTFDPREFVGGVSIDYWTFVNDPAQYQPLTNRPISGQYPPGSVFKIVSGAAMYEAGLVTPSTLIGCPPSFTAADVTFRNWNTVDEGRMNLSTALKRSCDTYFYVLAFQQWQREQRSETPDEIMQRVAVEFGMGSRLGIDLPGEQAGVVPGRAWRQEFWLRYRDGYCSRAEAAALESLERELLTDLCRFGGLWRGGDAVNMSIGQGDVLTTPLQIASAYQAVANDGVLLRPVVGRELRTADGELVRTIEPEVLATLSLSDAELQSLRRGLERVVMEPGGTAVGAFAGFPLQTVPVAGKTGTAERKPRVPYAWFAAYAPADDPRYVVVVSVEEGGGGSQTAAPIARRILEHLFDVRRPQDVPGFVPGPEILD